MAIVRRNLPVEALIPSGILITRNRIIGDKRLPATDPFYNLGPKLSTLPHLKRLSANQLLGEAQGAQSKDKMAGLLLAAAIHYADAADLGRLETSKDDDMLLAAQAYRGIAAYLKKAENEPMIMRRFGDIVKHSLGEGEQLVCALGFVPTPSDLESVAAAMEAQSNVLKPSPVVVQWLLGRPIFRNPEVEMIRSISEKLVSP